MAKGSFFAELSRRNVFRVALAYLAGAWLLIQVADTVFPAYGLPPGALTVLITLVAIAFLPALVLSWVFEWTPEGLRRDADVTAGGPAPASNWLDRIIVVTLVLAVGYFALDKFLLDPARDAARIEEAREEGRTDAIVGSYGDRSIAVLPFVNMSSDADQEYFSDGITEELLNLLAKIPELRVISRSTAFTFKGKEIVIPEVAKKLNVAHILEGSVRRSGNKLRITAQLIDARTDTHLWSDTYDRELDDIFVIQDEIAAKVVADLKLRLTGGLPQIEPVAPRVYDMYLQARFMLHAHEGESETEAAALLEKVVELEPAWVRGISELLRAHYRLHAAHPDQAAYHEQRAWSLLDRLFELEPQGAAAESWLGFLTWQWKNDLQQAAVHLERASRREPYNIDILRGLTVFLGSLNRNDEAIAVAEYVIDRDPACAVCISLLGFNLRQSGRHREAAEKFAGMLEWHPPSEAILWPLGVAWLVAGEPQRALDTFERIGYPPGENLGRLLALHDLGRKDDFDREFARYRELNSEFPEGVARVYAWSGNRDEAFRWLERMVDLRGQASAATVKTDLYDRIKDDPRWPAFLAKYGQTDADMSRIEFHPTYPPEVQAALR